MDGEVTVKRVTISIYIYMEFHQYLVAKITMGYYCITVERTCFSHKVKEGFIGLKITVSTISVMRIFLQMKLIKTCLSTAFSDCSLSHLMMIIMGAP